MTITLWRPEPDRVLHQALGKLAEECAELSHALTRCLIQGYREEEPVTHKLNRTQVMEEVADVKAAMRWLHDVLDEPFKGESERERRKFDGFKNWQAMLEADPLPDRQIRDFVRAAYDAGFNHARTFSNDGKIDYRGQQVETTIGGEIISIVRPRSR